MLDGTYIKLALHSSMAIFLLNKHSSSPTMDTSLSLNKPSSSSSMDPSLSLNKPSSSITSKILNEGKISDGLPRAFVTFLAGKGDGKMGVVGLAKGLRKVKTAYPLVVAYLPGVPEKDLRLLESQGCLLRKVQPVSSTQLVGRNGIKFCKLRLWDLDGYEKLVYLDFKVQVFHNIDELFDYPEEENGDCGVLYAVLDCFCEKTDNLPDNINLCQKKLYFNDGLFVFQPSKKTFKYLIEILELIPPTPTPSVVQDYLNMFFKGVYKPISLIYNLNLPMLWNHPEHVVEDLDKVKVVHFCAKGSLPWRYPGEEENMQREEVKLLVEKWWDVYKDKSLDYKPPAQEDRLEPVRL